MNHDLVLQIFKKHLLTKADYVSAKKLNVYRDYDFVEYEQFINWCNETYPTLKLSQIYRLVKNNILSPLICQNKNCNNIIRSENRSNHDNCNFSYYCCTECSNSSEDRIQKSLTTKQELYGGNGFELQSHRDKACATMLERYGVEWYTIAKDFKEKVIKTSLQKYGTVHPFKSTIVQNNYKNSMMKKYGVKNTFDKNSIFRKQAMGVIENIYGNSQIMRTSYIRSLNESRGIWIPNARKSDFEVYHKEVWKETNDTISSNSIKNIELRSKFYHLDHKVSIFEGYSNNIEPKIIGSVYNLEIISAKANCGKGKRCSQTIEHLLLQYYSRS